ncbi:MAG: glycosyltransferase family 2 protein [Janthinobacterium lividum]
MNPVLSLVIATLDRVVQLECCLASLPQHCDAIEVVVVDQSVTHSASDVVQRFRSRLRISYQYQEVPAASSARNLGVAYARGEWVGFPDDDAHFCDDTISALMAAIKTNRWDVVSGMTCDEAGVPTVVSWRKKATPITRRSLRDTVAESTLFLRRSVFLECGGFDPIFGPGGLFGAEEAIDLLRRMLLRLPRLRTQYLPQIRLVHADSSPYGDADALRKAHRYARARGACFARHWKQASKRRITSEVCRHIIGSVVFRGLRQQSRIDCLRGYVAGFREYRRMHVTAQPHPQLVLKAMPPKQICEP